jgi:microcystin-dependent protein
MAEPFLGEVRLMSFNFPPKGWALCNGQLLPINQNQALFALLGTRYGGNGQTTFALPNLRGRVPMHRSASHTLGEQAGTEAVTLGFAQMPQHLHFAQASTSAANQALPAGNVLAAAGGSYVTPPAGASAPSGLTTLEPSSLQSVGGSQAHTNMQPYLVITFCIALQGIFPSQN